MIRCMSTEKEINEEIRFLLDKANRYCEKHRIALSTLGRLIVNDGKFFLNLRSGKSCRIDTYHRVKSWFKDNANSLPSKT